MPVNLSQNIIAIIWDFDGTLIPNYMQFPLFKKFNINPKLFWKEVNQLSALYQREGITVNSDTVYLNHLLTYVQQGKCKGLNNKMLNVLGKEIRFFPGIPQFFSDTQEIVLNDPLLSNFDIKVEHYVVSTGLSEMIKGSIISDHVDGIWGCEFIQNPFVSQNGKLVKQKPDNEEISSIAFSIDNTTKTRAIFEINKGVNKVSELSVNQKLDFEDRRVPFENIIYIADGPSDVPAFSVVKSRGGKTFAVYKKNKVESFRQANSLKEDDRVHLIGEADYRKDTITYLWITEQIKDIANNIIKKKKSKLLEGSQGIPKHLS